MKTAALWQELTVKYRPKVRYWLPGAAVEEEDLREEIRQLFARGFGGVEVVVLALSNKEIVNSENGWGTERWNQVVSVIADETEKLGMTMDLANGPGWPISMPTVTSADDPAALHELTYGVVEVEAGQHYQGPLPQPRVTHDEGKPVFVHALAYQLVGEKTLRQESYLDLRPFLRDGQLDFTLPEGGPAWVIFAFYEQPAVQKTNGGQCYVIDHLNKAGVKACQQYWDEIFSSHKYPSMESFFCDSLEYRVCLDWTGDLPEEFEKRRGYSLQPYLPFIGLKGIFPPCDLPGYQLDDPRISQSVNHDYLEVLTQLYCENHLQGLEEMAQKYDKTVRYQVGYNKPFEVERCGLYVSIPENEALGRPALDPLKTMSAAAHLGRKDRCSFECAAEFGHSYGQDYEDLFWWVKRGLIAGLNAQVLHGASYSGGYQGKNTQDGHYPGVEWPGYEGFRKHVSNYWNRTPSIDHARGCMDAITRLNTVFRRTAKVDCAILRTSYFNNGLVSEFGFYEDDGMLANLGYNYETLSPALLSHPNCIVTDHLLDQEGPAYQVLIIPETSQASSQLLERVKSLTDAGLPVIWIGEKPISSFFYSDSRTKDQCDYWEQLLEQVWQSVVHVASKSEVPDKLEELGIHPRVLLPDAAMDIMTVVRQDGSSRYFALYGYNRVICAPGEPHVETLCSSAFRMGTTKGTYVRPGSSSKRLNTVVLSGKGTVYDLNYWDGTQEPLAFSYDKEKNAMVGCIELEEDEMRLLLLEPESAAQNIPTFQMEKSVPVKWDRVEFRAFKPNTPGEISFLRSGFSREINSFPIDQLKPWRFLDQSLDNFSGMGTYYGSIQLEEVLSDARYFLCLGNVCDTFMVSVNGVKTCFPDQVMKRVEITGLLRQGTNQLTMEVVSNLYNQVFVTEPDPAGNITPKYPRNYGIWESQGKQLCLEVWSGN